MSSASIFIESARRFEFKYRLTYLQYLKVRNAILPYMNPDHFTRAASGKKYLVRSLYFDTYDYRAYDEKLSGDSERVKFRMRTYSDSMAGTPAIRVELKVRKANTMVKHGSFISAGDYLSFMQNWHWPTAGNPILDEFERYLHWKTLQPQVLVEYRREGYTARDKDNLRITFDHRVQSAHCASLFPASPVFFRAHHPHSVVLEIKCHDRQPAWLRNLVQQHGLKLVANSKFTQAIQAARQDLYYPDGVVVIR